MKKFVLLLVVLAALSGCDKGPCEEMDCQNAGECMTGSCDCAEGFEGYRCQWREIDKFLGTYGKGDLLCTEASNDAPQHVISESRLGNHYFKIEDGIHGEPIQAEVDGWNFDIPKQENRLLSANGEALGVVELEGQGWIDESKGILVYKLLNSDCQVELELPNG